MLYKTRLKIKAKTIKLNNEQTLWCEKNIATSTLKTKTVNNSTNTRAKDMMDTGEYHLSVATGATNKGLCRAIQHKCKSKLTCKYISVMYIS